MTKFLGAFEFHSTRRANTEFIIYFYESGDELIREFIYLFVMSYQRLVSQTLLSCKLVVVNLVSNGFLFSSFDLTAKMIDKSVSVDSNSKSLQLLSPIFSLS